MCLQVCLKWRTSQECISPSKRIARKSGCLCCHCRGSWEKPQQRCGVIDPKRRQTCTSPGAVVPVPEQELQTQFGSDWKDEHDCMNAGGAEVSLYSSISELQFWGSFAKEMVTFESTKARRRWWEIGSGWSCSTKEFMCHHPPRSAWLPTFYWKLSSQCPDGVGKHLLCFYRQTKHWVDSLITLGNFLCHYPHVFSTWCWFLAGPGFTLIHQTISFSLHQPRAGISLQWVAASYWCSEGFVTGC